MVIIVSSYFIRVPISEIGSSLRELLNMPPKGKVPAQIKQYVKTIRIEHEFIESFTRVSKVGQTLWVEVDFVAKVGSDIIETISEQDEIRNKFIATFHNTHMKYGLRYHLLKTVSGQFKQRTSR